MAGLWIPKILLIWAGITASATSGPSPPPQCFYQVTPIQGGFLITMMKMTLAGNYIITVTENNQTVKQEKVFVSDQNPTHEIKHLKPCTEYELSVVRADGGIGCNSDASKTETVQMIDDIKKVNHYRPGHVCYQSDWNIIASLSPASNDKYEERENGKFCLKLAEEDFCSDLNISITPENCVNSSFNHIRYISLDFIGPQNIIQNRPTGFPVEIETTLPPNCKNFTVNYTCSESGKVNQAIHISDVEPFTQYSCTGLIQHHSVSIETPPVQVYIDCDLIISITKTKETSTSTELTWKTTSTNCGGFLQKFTKLNYTISNCPAPVTCARITPDGGTCELTGLEPWTDYSCKVQPTYNNRDVSDSESFKWRTEA